MKKNLSLFCLFLSIGVAGTAFSQEKSAKPAEAHTPDGDGWNGCCHHSNEHAARSRTGSVRGSRWRKV